ncbi:MAG: 1-(5-phosphoribosyl)-5-[(5-phosphoribosylamino)methylideneamino]imidazole-4-carboxamide isomerase [Chloroflexi bacterium]|nr:1-(5-phosphoribosyl)-5-[(5-phosphoribosylamino)methylideneamino]imidazole-4-carboxamide isomerase [Chloroflexota bacterium]
MIIYPAIDIRQGRVVRLLHGDPHLESVYGYHPVATAQKWRDAGAEWVHIVNLDGTLGEETTIFDIVQQIAKLGLSVQFAGGLRNFDAAQQAIEAGAARVVFGTLLVKQPELAAEAVQKFGAERVVVALDAKGGQVATHGWQEKSAWSPVELGQRLAADGIRHALYTDVDKDGDLSGVNIEATAALADATGLQVIASGGVAKLDDIHALKATGKIGGVIIGRALYAGIFSLEEVLEAMAT